MNALLREMQMAMARGAPVGAAAARIAAVMVAGDGSNFDHSKALPSFDVPALALIVVKLATLNSGVINTLTDTAGNVYLKAVGWNDSSTGEIWYCLASKAKTGNVITAAFTNGNTSYGLSGEAYTGGAFALDAANSGTALGTYTTSALVSGAISAAKGSLIATAFAQYNETWTPATASQTPGSVVNTGIVAGSPLMASGEVIPTAPLSGTITVDIAKTAAAYTKRCLGYATFTCT